MKIALYLPDSEFSAHFSQELKTRLPGHQYVDWPVGGEAPAFDLEVVFVEGKLTAAQMKTQPKLVLVQTVTAGYDSVDIDAAAELGIWVSYAPSRITGSGISVAEFAVLLLLGASRKLNLALQSVHDHSIPPPQEGPSLYGKTVCIVGLGSIGHLLAERLRPFGMRILATDDHPENVPDFVDVSPSSKLKETVGKADYVVLCAQADKENENLIDAAVLSAMRKGSILVNVARGTLIDEDALYAAVKSGQISAAGLDVLKTEPADANNPLLTLPQVLVTPHIAGFTALTQSGLVEYLAKVLGQFEAGEEIESVVKTPSSPRRPLRKAVCYAGT